MAQESPGDAVLIIRSSARASHAFFGAADNCFTASPEAILSAELYSAGKPEWILPRIPSAEDLPARTIPAGDSALNRRGTIRNDSSWKPAWRMGDRAVSNPDPAEPVWRRDRERRRARATGACCNQGTETRQQSTHPVVDIRRCPLLPRQQHCR